MKNIKLLVILAFSILSFSSCEKLLMQDELSADAVNNFNVLSRVIGEKYSYLKLKSIDWDAIVEEFRDSIHNGMPVVDEFRIYNKMLYRLKDGHVNLRSGFDISRNWEWYLDSPPNFDWDLIERQYLGEDYSISGGLYHTILSEGDSKYTYVYYGSFSSSVSYIEYVKAIAKSNKVKGMIIDVRNNGGGYIDHAETFASSFADKKRVGYTKVIKNGPLPNDFSDTITKYISPIGEKWDKPIVLLTNRKCFSSTSFFVTMMKEFPNVTVLGDATGGGAGLPVDYTLPNGWILRYSTTKAMDARGVDFELGVEADVYLDLDAYWQSIGKDNLIERAEAIIDGK